MPDGSEVGRATNMKALEDHIRKIPDESLMFHAERNHFSKWLKARTEFWLAHKLRPRRVSDFRSVDDLRQHLLRSIRNYQEYRLKGIITEFNKESLKTVLQELEQDPSAGKQGVWVL
jgi:hypothetical protein